MAVGFKVKFYWFQIGMGDFLHSIFSTVCYNLEDSKWGSKYPFIMNELYAGELSSNNVDKAILELDEIKGKFERLSCDKVIWDIENLDLKAPWGYNISPDITNLGNYFITSDGEEFFTIFKHALEKAKSLNTGLKISTKKIDC